MDFEHTNSDLNLSAEDVAAVERVRSFLMSGEGERRPQVGTGGRMCLGKLLESCVLAGPQEKAARTQSEFLQIMRRALSEGGSLLLESVAMLKAADCQLLLERMYDSPIMQRKARAVLHAVMAQAISTGLCRRNPFDRVVLASLPVAPERSILSFQQVCALLRLPGERRHSACAVPLGLMLWAGLSPAEMKQLCLSHLDMEKQQILLPGPDGVTPIRMVPSLVRWLSGCLVLRSRREPVLPPDWSRRWKLLRDDLSGVEWQQNIVQRTYAAYKAAYYEPDGAATEWQDLLPSRDELRRFWGE